jgi:hypothetical protein
MLHSPRSVLVISHDDGGQLKTERNDDSGKMIWVFKTRDVRRIWRRETQHWLPAESSPRVIRVVLGVERGKEANCTAREGVSSTFSTFFFSFSLSTPKTTLFSISSGP